MNILTLNVGSNSLKFEIVAIEPSGQEAEQPSRFGRSVIAGTYDDIGKEQSGFSLLEGKQPY